GFTHYGPSAGLPEVCEAIAEHVRSDRGVAVERDQVVVTPGGKSVIFFSLMALVEPGDEVIYPDPGFPNYRMTIELLGVVAFPFGTPLKEDKDGKPKAGRIAPFDPTASGAQRLYSALIAPPQVQSILSSPNGSAKISRIAFVSHGRFFNDFPFCALHSGPSLREGSFLIEEYEVVVYPSLQWQASSLRTFQDRQKTVDPARLGLVSPDLKDSAKPLFCALGEGMRIVYGADDGGQIDLAREALFSSAGFAGPIIVVAHGSEWPVPCLHLAARDKDGRFLRNGDIFLLDVYGRVRLDSCDVLALLVCFAHRQTFPLGGEWNSMTAAFLARGARSILAAPYALHVDSASKLLGKVFNEIADGVPAPAALRDVQCAFARGGIEGYERRRHPYYWALSCIGDPRSG
ncbi:MAG: aminotransferase class I/II-fold pyridoxal phosphate-dependent enzyme, partial [Candidatus Binatia bacterium]